MLIICILKYMQKKSKRLTAIGPIAIIFPMEKRHILILSANTGEGHNAAASALKEAFEERGCTCRVLDGLSFLPGFINRIICKGHIFLYRRLPGPYGAAYRAAELISRKPLSRRPKAVKYNRKLLKFLEDGNFDAIICTHVFAAQLVSRLRLSGKLALPCYFLATDYSCSPFVNRLNIDVWLIPHEKLIPEFAGRGIPVEKIIPAGIPVRREFRTHEGREGLRKKLNLPLDKKIVAISCGSMGAGHMDRLVLRLAKKLDEDVLLIALCGSNHPLAEKLQKHADGKRLLALDFVDKLSDYMEAADIYLTKPGGLSTTEALHKGTPVLLFNAVPGVETRNLEFLTKTGCAAAADDIEGIAACIRKMPRIDAACTAAFDSHAGERICEIMRKKELSN